MRYSWVFFCASVFLSLHFQIQLLDLTLFLYEAIWLGWFLVDSVGWMLSNKSLLHSYWTGQKRYTPSIHSTLYTEHPPNAIHRAYTQRYALSIYSTLYTEHPPNAIHRASTQRYTPSIHPTLYTEHPPNAIHRASIQRYTPAWWICLAAKGRHALFWLDTTKMASRIWLDTRFWWMLSTDMVDTVHFCTTFYTINTIIPTKYPLGPPSQVPYTTPRNYTPKPNLSRFLSQILLLSFAVGYTCNQKWHKFHEWTAMHCIHSTRGNKNQ